MAKWRGGGGGVAMASKCNNGVKMAAKMSKWRTNREWRNPMAMAAAKSLAA
jgi:hypothetical protein